MKPSHMDSTTAELPAPGKVQGTAGTPTVHMKWMNKVYNNDYLMCESRRATMLSYLQVRGKVVGFLFAVTSYLFQSSKPMELI